MIVAQLGAVVVIPLWIFAPTMGLLFAGGFLIQFMVQGAWGVIPAHLSELSPDSVRGFLPGFAYQCGVLIAGTIAYLQAAAAVGRTYAAAMALTAAIVFVGCAVVAALGPQRRGRVYGEAEGRDESRIREDRLRQHHGDDPLVPSTRGDGAPRAAASAAGPTSD